MSAAAQGHLWKDGVLASRSPLPFHEPAWSAAVLKASRSSLRRAPVQGFKARTLDCGILTLTLSQRERD